MQSQKLHPSTEHLKCKPEWILFKIKELPTGHWGYSVVSDPRRIPKSPRMLSELLTGTIGDSRWVLWSPCSLGVWPSPAPLSALLPASWPWASWPAAHLPSNMHPKGPESPEHQSGRKPPTPAQEETPSSVPLQPSLPFFILLTPALCTRGYTSGSLLGSKVSIGMDLSYSWMCRALSRVIASPTVINWMTELTWTKHVALCGHDRMQLNAMEKPGLWKHSSVKTTQHGTQSPQGRLSTRTSACSSFRGFAS